MSERILVVEDDDTTARTLSLYLERAGYEVECVGDGQRALDRAREVPPDLLVLDLMLPGRSGLDVCRQLRRSTAVPIVMLTARTTEDDRVRGLDLGADDYVAKPFSPRELVSRVRAVLRRSGHPDDGRLMRGDLVVDRRRHEATLRGTRLTLTRMEFRLLEALAASPGRAFSRAELLARCGDGDGRALDRTIDAHVMNLRRKIEDDPVAPRRVVTVYGVGYRYGTGDD